MSNPAACITRRALLKHSAVIALTPQLIPAWALGGDGAIAPSNRITLGFVGVGMMGQGHVRSLLGYTEAQVLAVCDVDRWRRQNAKTLADETYSSRSARGETYAAARPGAYRGCQAYNDLRELLSREDIDAVVIATGDNWHATATVLAAKAGKDIYCEKPLSLTVREARAMVEAVRRYGRVFQAGLQQRSSGEFRKACQLVRGGAIGRIERVYVNHPGTNSDVSLPAEPVPEGLDWDLWLGPAPWRPFHSRFHHYGRPPRVVPWDFCCDFGGGNLTSNGVHAFDVVQWGLNMDESGPVEITPPGVNQAAVLTYKYANGVLLQVVGARLDRQQHVVPAGWDEKTPISMFGAVFVGQKGWIHVGRSGYLKCYPAEIGEQPAGDHEPRRAVGNHHQNWLECIKTRQRPACDVAVGARSTIVAQLGCIAHWTGRALRWDPAGEVFVGDDEANRLLGRAMRPPWRI